MRIFIALMVVSYKKRNQFQNDRDDRKSDLGW